uniref:Uncharacterized protein n=1 Tax=Nothoprocta perdicaria TaxID=30464 RepID=A0A8C6ZVG2_NOTPE
KIPVVYKSRRFPVLSNKFLFSCKSTRAFDINDRRKFTCISRWEGGRFYRRDSWCMAVGRKNWMKWLREWRESQGGPGHWASPGGAA